MYFPKIVRLVGDGTLRIPAKLRATNLVRPGLAHGGTRKSVTFAIDPVPDVFKTIPGQVSRIFTSNVEPFVS